MNGRNELPIPPASPERQLKLEQSAQESANYTRKDRTAVGHEIKVRYIAGITV